MATELNINVSGSGGVQQPGPGPGQTGHVYPGGYQAPPSSGSYTASAQAPQFPGGVSSVRQQAGANTGVASGVGQSPDSAGMTPQQESWVNRAAARADRETDRRAKQAVRENRGLGIWRQAGRFAIGEMGADLLGRYGGYAASAVGARVGDLAATGSFAARASIVGAAAIGAGVQLAGHGARRAEELAAYSGQLAAVDARVQTMRMRSDMDSADRYGEGLGVIRESVVKLQISGTKLMDSVSNAVSPALEKIASGIAAVLDHLRKIVDRGAEVGTPADTVNDMLDFFENLDIPGVGMVAERERQRNRNHKAAPVAAAAGVRRGFGPAGQPWILNAMMGRF